jgi:hypothetical protein
MQFYPYFYHFLYSSLGRETRFHTHTNQQAKLRLCIFLIFRCSDTRQGDTDSELNGSEHFLNLNCFKLLRNLPVSFSIGLQLQRMTCEVVAVGFLEGALAEFSSTDGVVRFLPGTHGGNIHKMSKTASFDPYHLIYYYHYLHHGPVVNH